VLYATQADLESQFGAQEVAIAADRDRTGSTDADSIAASVLKSLTDASEEIDSYLATRYELPLATAPGVLTRVCGDIAMYRMSSDRGALTDEKRTRYEDAVKWLTALSAGKATLGLQDATDQVADLPQASSDNPARIFTRSKMGLL